MKSTTTLLLFLFAIVCSAVADSSLSVNASYNNGYVRFEVVDGNHEPVLGLQVVVGTDDMPSKKAVFKNGAYEIDITLPSGITEFNTRVLSQFLFFITQIRSQEGTIIFNKKVSVVSTVEFIIPSVSVIIDKATTEIAIPVNKQMSFSLNPKSSVTVRTTPKTVDDFVPTTALFVIASGNKKISLPMTKNRVKTIEIIHFQNAFELTFVPSRTDIALPFDYEKGEYEFLILFGDVLLSPLTISICKASIDFGAVPEDPIYPIYSKPLLYQSENSVKPLKEIEHVFRPENKNPFFLFPIAFSVAILCMIPALFFLFKKIGFEKKEEVVSKKIWKILYFACITTFVVLYLYFWIGWNMISLLKVIIPFAVVTAIIGNRAL